MKKRIVCLSTVLALGVLLSGCGVAYPELSPEDTKAVSDYAAYILLRYDANSRSRLVSINENDIPVKEALTPIEDFDASVLNDEDYPEATGMIEDKGDDLGELNFVDVGDGGTHDEIGDVVFGEPNNSFADVFQLTDEVNIIYNGYRIAESYPEGEDLHFSLDASKGKKLIICEFTIANNTDDTVRVDNFSKNLKIKATFNGDIQKNALDNTLLPNELSTYASDISGGASEDVVLIFEIDSNVSDSLNSFEISIKNAQNIYTIKLL